MNECGVPDLLRNNRLTKPSAKWPTGRVVNGTPICRRPAGHDGCHRGDGAIWNKTMSRGSTKWRKAMIAMRVAGDPF